MLPETVALCLDQCTDDTFELAHVFGDGNQEKRSRRGAGNIAVRDGLDREEGMERLKGGRLVLLCPNCHRRYYAEHDAKPDRSCSITQKDLQTRGQLLFEQNKWLADKMAEVSAFNHANNGCGRLQQATIPEELTTVVMDLVGPSADQARALEKLSQAKGQQEPENINRIENTNRKFVHRIFYLRLCS